MRDKLSALHRTLLRDRMNGMAFMAELLPYNNAPLTIEVSVAIHFETRNCEAAKAVQDCVLFAPALQVVPKRASEFLKASLAIGHIGGTISSPPMENGYKQIHVTLPGRGAGNKAISAPIQWLQDLSDEYEKWVLGTLEVAF